MFEIIENLNRNIEGCFNKKMFKRIIYHNTDNFIEYDSKENQTIIDKVNCKLKENVREKRSLWEIW